MHAIEKILCAHSGRNEVHTGEIIMCDVDFAEINDLYLQTIYSFREMGGKKVWDPARAAFVFDHYAPAPNIQAAAIHKEMRAFAQEQGLQYHFDINAGVCHQVMPEAGLITPGMILVATDSHSTTHGAFGAFGTGVGATDLACTLIEGKLWFRVPEIVEIRLDGKPAPGTLPKDVILYVLGQIRANGAVYKAIEFTGDYVESLSVAGRMVLCNMAVEMGAKTAYMQPNQAVLDYVAARAQRPYVLFCTDPDYVYAQRWHFCIEDLPAQVALPHSVENVSPITKAPRIPVTQGFIGACTGGRMEDIAVAAKILAGKRIPRGVRLVINPASAEVLRACMDTGYIQQLVEAGATLATPGCGPCLGAHQGCIAEGEVCVSASNRNFPGRMGAKGGALYLASPATVAASVLHGVLSDPREFFQEQ